MKILVIGGAGFIGSHLVDALVARGDSVTVYDNLSVGKPEYVNERAKFIRGDALDEDRLCRAVRSKYFDLLFHLSANPEARRGLEDTKLDLLQGTVATRNALEAVRLAGAAGITRFVLASSGTVYGDGGHHECYEDNLGGTLPISLYGASKLASEALVGAFQECFGIQGTILRFGNVVGPRATHGAILDFCRRLKENPDCLEVLGDGSQSKPYLHVTECVQGMLHAATEIEDELGIFNLAPDGGTSVQRIAELCVAASSNQKAAIRYGTRPKGWKGDVPTSRLNTEWLAERGFKVSMSSDEAVERAVSEVASEVFGHKAP
jgi:UDP-glucose 4-epimerase